MYKVKENLMNQITTYVYHVNKSLDQIVKQKYIMIVAPNHQIHRYYIIIVEEKEILSFKTAIKLINLKAYFTIKGQMMMKMEI